MTPSNRLRFAVPQVVKTDLPDGGMLLRSAHELGPCPGSVCDYLEKWAGLAPDRVFVAERDGQGSWKSATYAQALEEVKRLAQGLLDRGLGQERPLMILSDNSVNAALLILAAMYAGVPVAPISPAYSLVSEDHAKLRYIYGIVRPGMVYAESGRKFARALKALDLSGVAVATAGDGVEGVSSTPLAELGAEPGQSLSAARAAITPDLPAKILFTSGSTGMPKGVINTHRMMCSNQEGFAILWPWLEETPPVLVDWLPWNHTFGGNHNFNLVLRNGGSYYIDEGKPVPGAILKSVANLKEVSPTIYFNVPKGFDVLLPFLEKDKELRNSFFKNLRMIFYAAAALPQPLWERLQNLSVLARGESTTMLSGWGATETSPSNTMVHTDIDRAGIIGCPMPGTTLKLVPNGGKLEVRLKGPNIMPGYFRNEEQTRAAFDEEGFYRIGDALKLVDPEDPSKGLLFDGRVTEDFKLTTGTWVHVGGLRVSAIEHAAPYVQDAVVTGHNRDWLGLLIWPNLDRCRELVGDADADAETLVADARVRAAISEGIGKHNAGAKGSSVRIERVALLAKPPSMDANEITDKGYINQSATLARRAEVVEALYAEAPGPEIIVLK